jgi:hypothetical protein
MKLSSILGVVMGAAALVIATLALIAAGGTTTAAPAAPAAPGTVADTAETRIPVELGDIYVRRRRSAPPPTPGWCWT